MEDMEVKHKGNEKHHAGMYIIQDGRIKEKKEM